MVFIIEQWFVFAFLLSLVPSTHLHHAEAFLLFLSHLHPAEAHFTLLISAHPAITPHSLRQRQIHAMKRLIIILLALCGSTVLNLLYEHNIRKGNEVRILVL